MSAPNPAKRDILISKALSYLLRHGAIKEKLNIDSKGYIPINELLNHNRLKSLQVKHEDIKRIVLNNDKQRFKIIKPNDVELICANQGHSISDVGNQSLIEFTEETIPDEIYHGTYLKKLDLIVSSGGLNKMSRNHIHFTNSGNNLSGIRKTCNVLIYIDGKKCLQDGIKFYRSDNGVILSSGIDGVINVKYWHKVFNLNNGEEISI